MDDAFDLQKLDKVIGDLICDVFDHSSLAKCKRFSIILNALPKVVLGDIAEDPIDLHTIQDSLSFLRENSIIRLWKDLDLQGENKTLRAQLAQLASIYYH